MGRQSTIFDPETISVISIRGLGRISPNQHNIRAAHCTQCQNAIVPQMGYAFRAERFGRLHSGYFCQACVGEILQSVHGWFFNKHFEILQPVIFDTPREMNGGDLASAWISGGITSLFEQVSR